MLYETKFLIALIATVALEMPAGFFIVKYFYKEKIRALKILSVLFFASFATLPYLWFIMRPYFDARTYLMTGEVIVTIFETLIFWQFLEIKIHKALLLSIVLNAFSYYVGKELLTLIF